MKILKEFLKYIILFITVIAILLALFVFVTSIPKKYVKNNLEEALSFFKKYHSGFIYVNKTRANTWLFPYMDQMYFNMIYCMNEEKPLDAVMKAEYYSQGENDGGNGKYIELLEEDLEPNQYYLRYWHGPIIILKLLLIIMTLEQIYGLNVICLSVLLFILIGIIVKNKYWSILIALMIGLIMTTFWYAPFTLNYAIIYALMFVACIVSITLENKKVENSKFYKIFFLVGILTCFFDFLTMELLTILVPLSMILTIRIKKNEDFELKKELWFTIKNLFLWFVGYAITYLAKWILAYLILDINVVDYIKDAAIKRINGSVSYYSFAEMMIKGIEKNIMTLFPFTELKKLEIGISLSICFSVISIILLIDIKNKNKRNFLLIMILIASIPYFRYIILSNHSYLHYFFTFRNQMGTVMCISLIVLNCLNTKKLFSKVEINKNT